MHLTPGQIAPNFRILDIKNQLIDLEQYRGKKTMISFYRYAGCPLCNMRSAEIRKNHEKLTQAGLNFIGFWQSTKAEMTEHLDQSQIMYPMIPDKQKRIYQLYGVENNKKSLARLMLEWKHLWKLVTHESLITNVTGDIDLVPADFLINPDLSIHTAHYGKHVGDHLPLAEVFRFAERGIDCHSYRFC